MSPLETIDFHARHGYSGRCPDPLCRVCAGDDDPESGAPAAIAVPQAARTLHSYERTSEARAAS